MPSIHSSRWRSTSRTKAWRCLIAASMTCFMRGLVRRNSAPVLQRAVRRVRSCRTCATSWSIVISPLVNVVGPARWRRRRRSPVRTVCRTATGRCRSPPHVDGRPTVDGGSQGHRGRIRDAVLHLLPRSLSSRAYAEQGSRRPAMSRSSPPLPCSDPILFGAVVVDRRLRSSGSLSGRQLRGRPGLGAGGGSGRDRTTPATGRGDGGGGCRRTDRVR